MRFRLAVLLIPLIAVGCAGHSAHPFAGMNRSAARAVAVRDATVLPNVEALSDDFVTSLRAKPIGTFPNRNSSGREAWLTVFRLFKHQQNDPDQACLWAWRDRLGVRTEEAPSVAYGHPSPAHDRCAHFVLRHHIASSEQVMGDEERYTFARPRAITPFGPLLRGSYPTDVCPSVDLFESGPDVIGPKGTAPATCGFVGRVEHGIPNPGIANGYVPHATVAVAPSRLARRQVLTADRWGTFAIVDLPYRKHGYLFWVHARGYRPAHERDECYRNDIASGKWIVRSRPGPRVAG